VVSRRREPTQRGVDGRQEARPEAKRHVVARLLRDVVGARLVGEAARAIVVASRDVRMHVDVDESRRRLAQRPQAVVVEHRQARPRVDERLGRHLHEQPPTRKLAARVKRCSRRHGNLYQSINRNLFSEQ